MRLVSRAEGTVGLPLLVVLVDLFDLQHGERHSLAVGEHDSVSLGRLLDGQADRQGPGEPVREVHVVEDALVVLAPHEALERGERPRSDHVQVGHLARGQA